MRVKPVRPVAVNLLRLVGQVPVVGLMISRTQIFPFEILKGNPQMSIFMGAIAAIKLLCDELEKRI